MVSTLMTLTQAKEMHAKARQVSASAIALIGDVNPAMNRVAMHAVPDTMAKRRHRNSAVVRIVWLAGFLLVRAVSERLQPGRLSGRRAEFSQGPQAQTLGTRPTPTTSVKDILFARRPDLGEIELTCENTNTVMPYVDLVLEVLEDAVAPPPAFSPFELDSDRIRRSRPG